MRTVRKATVYKRWNGGLGLCGTCLGLLSDTCQSPPSHTVREMNTAIEIPQTDKTFFWKLPVSSGRHLKMVKSQSS